MTSGFSIRHIVLLTSYRYSKIVSEHLQRIQSYAVQEKQEAGLSFLAAAVNLTEMLVNWQQTGSPDPEVDTQGVIITYPIRNIWIPCISRAHIESEFSLLQRPSAEDSRNTNDQLEKSGFRPTKVSIFDLLLKFREQLWCA
ncbi:Rho Gtpase-Activating Protein 7 [Manis pentadactyla]|nr:Rho Gtpase-Activating Protein 7 [Manis pentadactyla]